MWTPTHVVITVTKARNLLEKGKGGNDAYCMIGMGKEKFLTSVKTKTLSPVWDEQAEFSLGEREDLKLTVYHKSSIIDEFIGRVVINVAELAAFDNNHSHVGWFKLGGKPDKSEHSKKPEKERGEIEVRIDFVVKPKAGSMMDLSMKSKEKSLSLRNLKDKSNTLKQSLGDKFKILQKSRKSKYAGENQLAEQAKKMGGSKVDFLDGDDIASITSSYSSINGANLQRFSDSKQINSMSRFNPTRSSFLSGSSSRLDNDSASNYGNEITRNEDDFEDENESGDFDRDSANGSSFQRRNSSKFGRSTNGPIKRQLSRRSSTLSTPIIEDLKIINENSKIEIREEQGDNSTEQSKDSIHIAPLPPFYNSTSTPSLPQRNQNKKQQKPSTASETTTTSLKPTSPVKNNQDDFASIFAASFNTTTSDISNNNKTNDSSQSKSHSTLTKTNSSETTFNSSNKSILKTTESPTAKSDQSLKKQQAPQLPVPSPPLPPQPSLQVSVQPPPLPPFSSSAQAKKNSFSHDEEDEDHIDWASSEDEEIVKQEIETFERHQVPNSLLLNTKLINLTEPFTTTTTTTTTNTSSTVDNKIQIENLFITSSEPSNSQVANSLFDDLFASLETTKPVNNSVSSKNHEQKSELANTFSIDIDPFSSSSSSESSFNNKNNKKPFVDPFGINLTTSSNKTVFDPFSVFDSFANIDFNTMSDEKESNDKIQSTHADDPFHAADEPINANIEQNEEPETPPSSIFFYRPSIALNNPQLTYVSQSIENGSGDDDDNIDNAFIAYSSETRSDETSNENDELSRISNELAETKLKLTEILEEEEPDTNVNSNLVDRVITSSSSSDSESVNSLRMDNKKEPSVKFSIDNIKITKDNDESEEETEKNEAARDKHEQFDDEEEEEAETNMDNYFTKEANNDQNQQQSTLSASPDPLEESKMNTLSRQSERRRLKPAEDLVSDLNSEADFHSISSSSKARPQSSVSRTSNNKMQLDLKLNNKNNTQIRSDDYDIKTPDIDVDFRFQDEISKKMDTTSDSNGAISNGNENGGSGRNNGLPDLVNQKGNNDSTDKARKYLEGLDGVKFNEIQVPDQLKKQLEYFDRDELLQLIAYQKKYLDFKESRIKDLENYIDNLVVKIIEKEPSILMNASNVLSKSRNLI